MKKIVYGIAVGLTVLGLSAQAQSPEAKGLDIAKKAEAADNGWGNSSNTLTMILKNKNGQTTTRQMRGKSMEVAGDGDKSITIFDSPADVAGTSSMTYTHKEGDDDQWLYLPAIRRVKRIASSNKSGPFMGSEFAFEDLSSQEVEKFTYKYIKDEAINGVECYVIERYPVSKTSGYSKQTVWIAKESYRAEKNDFYDRKGTLIKTLTFKGYKKYLDKYWRADEMQMVNHRTKKETILKFSEYKFNDASVTDEDFTQSALQTAN